MTAATDDDASRAGRMKSRGWVVACIVFVLAFDLAFFWQRAGEAHESEFGAHPDEAAHYVTGLFVRDALVMVGRYAADGFPGSPVQVGKEFADTYYAHYPKIGLGVWPPFFYLVQAAWTLPFSPARASLLLLLCVLAAVVATQLFRVLREEFGLVPAALGAALWLTLPLVRNGYGMVMAETLSASLMFGAVLAFGNFLDREKRGDALRFGLLAALAILTKGTGLARARAAPLALLFTRRFHLLRRPALWLAVLLVAVLAGPWTWATRHLGAGGWVQPSPSWQFTAEALPYYVGKLGVGLGLVAALLFCLGAFVQFRATSGPRGRWAAAGAFVISVVIFQSLAPVGFEARHLIPVLPAALMFAVAGFAALTASWRRQSLAAGFGFLIVAGSVLPLEKKGCRGFEPLARSVLAAAGPTEITLVSSEARGEGMFIAEVAMRERRPGHIIQRASKALASSTWSGGDYAPQFATDDALLAFLTGGKIRYLVLDDAIPEAKRCAHHDQLKRVIAGHEDRFSLLQESEIIRGGEPQLAPVRLYKVHAKD